MKNALFEKLERVTDEASFLAFVSALRDDRIAAESAEVTLDGFQGGWANQSIGDFLDAALSWAEDSDFASRPGLKPANPWALFAMFLWAGRCYE